MYDFEDSRNFTTFPTVKDANEVFNESKQDRDQDSDSTIIIEDADIVACQRFNDSKNSLKKMTDYPTTSKMAYSDYNSQLESILLKYSSPPLELNHTIESNRRISSTKIEKCELIELSSDEDENLPQNPIQVIEDNVAKCRVDFNNSDLLQNYYTPNENYEELPQFQLKNNSLDPITFEKNMMDVDNDQLSNKGVQIVDKEHVPWTNIRNHKESSVIDHEETLNKFKTVYNNNSPINTKTNHQQTNYRDDNSLDVYKSPGKKRKLSSEEKNKKANKINLQAKKREEAERAKKIKQTIVAQNKNMRPEECMKFMTILLDSQMASENYAGDILNALQAADITYNLQSQLIPNTISWIRKVETHFMDKEQLTTTTENTETNEILLIIKWMEIVELVHNRSLVTHIKSLQSILSNKKISLAIYGMENYLKYQKSQKQKEARTEITGALQRTNNKNDKIYKDAPKISRKQLEFALTELQLLCCCCHRFVETTHDLATMIVQFTKSIAQTPYKLEKQHKQQEQEWYISGDNKDCVQVDKNGNGLQRLWQQQLTTFPLARLEHAEAIVAQYSTPTSLMEEYSRCTQAEGEKLLQDISIRRAAGPLTTGRKIGPELSKKIFKFFTSRDGNIVL